MKQPLVVLAIALALSAAGGAAPRPPACPSPLWSVDLISAYGFERLPVGRGSRIRATWARLTFTSPDTLVAYQVVQNAAERLETRGEGGSYVLRAVFVNPRDGSVKRRMQWDTSSEFANPLLSSGVLPTLDGYFLVRTGLKLRSYSANFQAVASMTLVPQERTCSLWTVLVVPPGRLLFANLFGCGPQASEKALLEAKSLKRVSTPSAADLAYWPEAWRSFPGVVAPPPSSVPAGTVTLEDLGKYNERAQHRDSYCASTVFLGVPHQDRNNGLGRCENVTVLTRDGRLWWRLHFGDHAGEVANSGNTLAVEVVHWPWDPFDLGLPPRPQRIEVYNTARMAEDCSLDLRKVPPRATVDFAISPDGLLAVRAGNRLSLYKL